MAASPYRTLIITNIIQETADTKSIELQPVDNAPLHYQAGQFLTLVFPKGHTEDRRSYSIASTASLGEPLVITFKRIANGEYSRFLFDRARVGDTLLTIGASGFFTLPEVPQDHSYYFMAAGSGITPMMPLIKTLLHHTAVKSVHLVYSNRSVESTIFYEALLDLQLKFKDRLHIIFLFSTSQNLMRARMNKFVLQQFVDAQLPTGRDKALFYLCGPHDYMQMIGITLLTEGIPAANIRKENFSTTKRIVKELPPDTDPHTVKFTYNGEAYTLAVQYPQTILAAAKEKGVVLPYSCEAGKCGTCAATCRQGKVWLSYNEVLLDKELEQGRVLTCVGYPYGPDPVELDFDN